MALPPLYKHLDVRARKLKPSDFNDAEDLSLQSIFPEEIEAALKTARPGMLGVILAHLYEPPTCALPIRESVLAIQMALRANTTLPARMEGAH